MVKSKFSSLDVRAMVNSVRPSVVGCKLTNIYDINSKVYLLKLARRGFKCFLLLETGVRFHLTSYDRDKSAIPSNYTMKLRKHIRMRRLTSIEQLGCDRCVDLTFGRGENAFHLVLELYVSGNLILTDHEYRIQALLRSHSNEHSKVALREIYPIDTATGLLVAPIEEFPDAIDEILNAAAARQENQELKEIDDDDEKAKSSRKKGESTFAKRSKKRVNHSAMPLVMLLHKLAPFADPALCANCISKAMKALERQCENAFKLTVEEFSFEETVELAQRSAEIVLQTLQSVSRPSDLGGGSMPVLAAPDEVDDDAADDLDDGDDKETMVSQEIARDTSDAIVVPGWIVRRRVHVPPTEPYWANDEFTPLPPESQTNPEAAVALPSFHECVDEFYTQLEEHKAVESKAQHAKTVYDRVERIRVDQGRRVNELEMEQNMRERQAFLIEANVDLVERALAMVNVMIASQIDWGELRREVKRQQRLGHPIAQHIHSLDLERNELQFLLSGLADDEENQDEDRPMEVVPLDLNMTPHANVARLHAKRKETRDKTSKTAAGGEMAVKQAEKKAQQDLQKFELKQTIRRVRKNWWFEKFFWFISSENYVVVAGHDAQQTEQIFTKHLGPKDAFVQADVTGARTCFVRNPSGGEIPPATLREAGTMALCHSAAWDKRMVISAWWVPVEQVSRGGDPPKGDYVLVDNFFVQGSRSFLPPLYLEMGLTLLFHVGEGSVSRHRGERRSRYLEAMAATQGSGNDCTAEAGDLCQDVRAEEGEDRLDAEHEDRKDEGPEELEQELVVDAADEGPRAENAEEAGAEEQADSRGDPEGPADPQDDEDEGNGADEKPAAEEEYDAPAETGGTSAGRVTRERISRADRKKLKKGGGGSDAVSNDTRAAQDFQPPAREKEPKTNANGPAQKTLPRGQKARAKKMKEKYADQDEEDRQLRFALLGIREPGKPGAGAGVPHPDDASSPTAADAPAAGPPPAAASAGRPPVRRQETARGGPRLTAGCEYEEGSPNLAQLEQLDHLTGQPLPEDEVLYAMAMVAPYCALGGHYAHRAKFTPGPGKKGPAVKQCLKMFEARMDRSAWKQLVSAIPENDTAGLMVGSCKVSMPGMQKLQNLVKKEKKKEDKGREGASKT